MAKANTINITFSQGQNMLGVGSQLKEVRRNSTADKGKVVMQI